MNRPSPSRVRVSGPLQAYTAGFREELLRLVTRRGRPPGICS